MNTQKTGHRCGWISRPGRGLILLAALFSTTACSEKETSLLEQRVEHRYRFYAGTEDHFELKECLVGTAEGPLVTESGRASYGTGEVKVGRCRVIFTIADYPNSGENYRFERVVIYLWEPETGDWEYFETRCL